MAWKIVLSALVVLWGTYSWYTFADLQRQITELELDLGFGDIDPSASWRTNLEKDRDDDNRD